jgi:hypothetical protein
VEVLAQLVRLQTNVLGDIGKEKHVVYIFNNYSP